MLKLKSKFGVLCAKFKVVVVVLGSAACKLKDLVKSKCCQVFLKLCCIKSCVVQGTLNLKVKVFSPWNLRGFLSVCVLGWS